MANKNGTPKKLVSEWVPVFLDKLRETGNVMRSCEVAGVGRTTAYTHREKTETFSKLWDDALADAVDFMDEEARRRAMYGVDEPIYHLGVCVDTIKKYSDTLLIYLLKVHGGPKYKDTLVNRHTGKDDDSPIEVAFTDLVKQAAQQRRERDGNRD